MVRFVKLFSLSTSAVGIAIQPVIYQHVSELPAVVAAIVGGMAGFFIFITPVLLHIVTKRYVTLMTCNEQTCEFTATTYSLFLREKQHKFTPAQVTVPNVPGIFTTIRVDNKLPLFIDPNLFTDRRYFVQLMKYDEPLEWEIHSDGKTDGTAKKGGQPPSE
jgi:transmembrane protein 70